ncbi:tail tape measure protein [Pseudomonas simiae]|jgi:hypothetical protein
MQETKYGVRLVQEDLRWMIGDADLGSVLTPFTAGLAAPVSLEAAPQPQPPLTSALMTVSTGLNALTQEQVRLRETLETLNSTLSAREQTLATKAADVTAAPGASEPKKPEPATRSWREQGLEMGTDAVKFVGKEVVSGLWDKAKDRLSGKALDAVADRYPTAAKWLKEDKDGNKGKECCCTGALPPDIRGSLEPVQSQVPEGVGKTARAQEKARPKDTRKKPRGPRSKTRQSSSREVKTSVVRRAMDLKSPRAVSAAKVSPPLNVVVQRQLQFEGTRASQAATGLPGRSFASSAALPTSRPLMRGAVKGLAAGLSGTLAKLESSAVRRLGPLRYVDTAMDVAQGVRNGDVKAIGAGLSTAGGAWAGASAGAAIGTLVFPGVGTAVGGAIGGLLGSEAGAWLGDKLFGPRDRLPAPADVGKHLSNAQADNRQLTFSPHITINAPEQASYQQLAALVVQQIEAQFTPLPMDSLLATRRDSALTDTGVA